MFNKDILQKMKEGIPFLSAVGEEDLNTVLQKSEIMAFKPGDMILEEGSYGSWIYYLVSGKVKILKDEEEVYTTQKTGEIFGEMSAIDGSARSASVYAVDDTMCLAIDLSGIDKNLIYKEFAQVLAARLRVTTEELSQAKKELEDVSLAKTLAALQKELVEANTEIQRLKSKIGEIDETEEQS